MKRISSLVLVFLVLFSFNVFAGEDNIVSEEVVIEETEIIEDVENIEDIENIENIEDIEDTVDHLTYIEVIEKIVQTINKRDSYYFEINNPEDYKSYMRKLEIDIPDEDIVTRIGFISLLNDITEKMTGVKPYTTDLIEVKSIFTDIEDLTEEEILDVEIAFCQGLMRGTTNNTLEPYTELDRSSFEIILNRLLEGYSRKNLFSVVESGFSQEDRNNILNGEEDKVLRYEDINSIVSIFSNIAIYPKLEDLSQPMTIGEFLKYYNTATRNRIILTSKDSFEYPAKDTVILSAEEWEYLIKNQDKEILYSEAKLLAERTRNAFEEIDNLNGFDNWEKVDNITKNYLPFINPLVNEYKRCILYFMDDFKGDANLDLFLAIHEAQHEGSAAKSNRFSCRRKLENMWQVRWSSRPSIYYYFDLTNGNWVGSKDINTYNTSTIYRNVCPEGLLTDSFLKDYCTNSDLIANIYGLQGLLQEYCSYALDGKLNMLSYSLGIDGRKVGYGEYNRVLKLKYMTIESVNYMKEKRLSQYERFMNDTDMIRMLNNIFKEFDYYERVFIKEFKKNSSQFYNLLDWSIKLNCPISFMVSIK